MDSAMLFNVLLDDRLEEVFVSSLLFKCGWDSDVCNMNQSRKYLTYAMIYTNKKDGYRQLNVHQLGSLCPWDNRGKCYMDWKRI